MDSTDLRSRQSLEKRSCNGKEIVWANWKKNEPARESNVNVIELE